MTPPIQPTPAPNVELELAKLANDAMAGGADPHDVTAKLHQTISYLRQFPKMAEHATNALADGVASPADISRTLWPHVEAMSHANGPGVSNAGTPEEDAKLPPDQPGMVGKAVSHLVNVAQGFPGGETAQVGFRMMGRGQSYDDAYRDIENATQQIPTGVKFAERLAGSLPAATMLPGGAVKSGAMVGGLDQALNADPNQSLGERGLRTAAGAGVGALAGKLVDGVVSGGRALLAKKPAALLLQKQAERAASARTLYGAALNEGQGATGTAAIKQFLGEPDIAEIVGELKQTRPFANVGEDSPEMLDAVYKTLSDRVGQVKKGLDAVTPNRPNIGRFRLADLNAAKSQALGVMSGTDAAPGPMPSYAKAVKDFADRTKEIEAIQRGYDTFRGSLSDNLPTAKNLTRKTPEAFAEWVKHATPEEVQAARQGITGGTKMALHASPNPLKGFGLPRAVSVGNRSADLLRQAPNAPQQWTDVLQNLGLLSAGNSATSP